MCFHQIASDKYHCERYNNRHCDKKLLQMQNPFIWRFLLLLHLQKQSIRSFLVVLFWYGTVCDAKFLRKNGLCETLLLPTGRYELSDFLLFHEEHLLSCIHYIAVWRFLTGTSGWYVWNSLFNGTLLWVEQDIHQFSTTIINAYFLCTSFSIDQLYQMPLTNAENTIPNLPQ